MTVATDLNRKTFTGDAVTTSFSTGLVVFFATSDLTVSVVTTSSGVATTLTENTHYTVTGGSGANGTVNLAAGSSPYGAPSALQTLVIVRNEPITQETDFVNNEATDAEVAEDAFDKLTMICQQINAKVNRSFVLADTDVSGASTTLPTPAATTLLGWNGAGTALQNYTTSGLSTALTTAYTLTLLDDPDAATARTTLGLSSPLATGSVYDAKGDLIVGTADNTAARLAVGTSNGQALAVDSSQTTGLVYIDNPSRPNLLINPNWQIDQINEGALYTVNTTDVRGPDGWSGSAVGAGVFKLRTLADPDNAALKCLEITCTTADASIAATDDYFIYSAIEGYDAAALQSGVSTPQQVTVQFKFKSNVTGVYGVSLANSAKNRSNYQIITVADTSEHEYSLTFTLDTTGTWLYTNGVGLYLAICLSAGSNFQGTAGAWAADAKQTTAAQCNFMSANTNIAYLKRIQLMQGALVQAYRPADIQKELAKAQRYYFKTYSPGVVPGTVSNIGAYRVTADATPAVVFNIPYPTSMRSVPTATLYSPATGTSGRVRNESTAADVVASVDTNYSNETHAHSSSSIAGSGQAVTAQLAASARLS